MTREELLQLTEKISSAKATTAEIALYNQWYNQYQEDQKWEINTMGDPNELEVLMLERIRSEIRPVKKIRKLYTRIAAAAAILIIFGGGLYFTRFSDNQDPDHIPYAAHIQTGGNKAILTLSNGKKIMLDDAGAGEVAKESGITISKSANGQITYTAAKTTALQTDKTAFNTIETPMGGQYRILLPDGTSVWLNAASSLTFPVIFSNTERSVKLSGEGYFEVAKDKIKPFRVQGGNQQVEVLGTHFNISSYADEPQTKTTLLEGSVRVNSDFTETHAILKPGEQAAFIGKQLLVYHVNTEEAVAWKNGYFNFNDEPLEGIMLKVARWYNVTVSFEDNELRREKYGAVTTRFDNVSALLNKLQQTGTARFKIDGKRIIITNK
ncbi:FecR family protein [Pedobacter metabolipauper]|uniref:FecR family protein n=1 Tax=Pedobacter metabolipauper TaxID=425513 RepID=A0A4R6SPW2_9SPHI|nr:FecR domain-containing protein [Pedobacter metabolipauper]TDQ06199.1 FecR family protein [Pedobacter metabolipauper]